MAELGREPRQFGSRVLSLDYCYTAYIHHSFPLTAVK